MASHRSNEQVARFVALTKPYHERLFRIALSVCNDRDQAADLTQEALIRAFKAFDRFRDGAPVLPWLARIMRNVHLDSFKTGRARHEVADHQRARHDPIYERTSSPAADPLAALERNRLAAMLREEIAGLDEAFGLVVTLCDIEGLSYEEAADVAGVPVGTVRSRLSRARRQLRVRLQERMVGERRAGSAPEREPQAVGTRSATGRRAES